MSRLTACLAIALLLAGCGARQSSTESSSSSSADSSPSPSVTACAREEAAVRDAPVLVSADLDGDGTAEDVRLTKPDSPCPGVLFGKVGGAVPSLRLDLQTAPTSAQAVQVPGRDGALVAVRETHPRGGYQLRLYGYADGELGEVTASGQPVVPFVATDSRGSFLSVTCDRDGLVVRRAVAHRPPGIVPAWDITETTYRIDGLKATPGDTREIADNVLDRALDTRFPALAGRQLFRSGCS